MRKMKSISINISDSMYKKFRDVLKQKDIGIEKGILEAINEFISKESEYKSDPFFKMGSSGESGVRDISKKHDLYLYEQ
ncbi:MAG: hypothetical protein A7316_11220 [Candidatus Altiarchaeales archaeon WOR_SM1_86-2]|nr:MAG: hypothetical protein A7316_11220 [Candidatus Altiarchaeales archaeon WOR_SM1_86-2]ODS39729.1 MAG: hypothetical protein A7315_10625 [Candidatus Altiarchaeales archaeon WOR_SM1_79]